ncbi:MAG: hypothetical protein AAF802_07655 [Planctomycetota bacterium]
MVTKPNPYEPPSEPKEEQESRSSSRFKRHLLLVVMTICAIVMLAFTAMHSIVVLRSPDYSPAQRLLRIGPIGLVIFVGTFVFARVAKLLEAEDV